MCPADLLSWPELRAAETRAAEAEESWRAAQRRAWLAPRGLKLRREQELRTASVTALTAERDLAMLRRELGE